MRAGEVLVLVVAGLGWTAGAAVLGAILLDAEVRVRRARRGRR